MTFIETNISFLMCYLDTLEFISADNFDLPFITLIFI